MREITAITVRNGSENIFSIMGRFEFDLSDAGKVPDRIGVLGIGRPDFMKINLLIKIQVRIWSFTFARKPRVINSGPVGVPSCAATGGGILHVRDCILPRFDGRCLDVVHYFIFATYSQYRHYV